MKSFGFGAGAAILAALTLTAQTQDQRPVDRGGVTVQVGEDVTPRADRPRNERESAADRSTAEQRETRRVPPAQGRTAEPRQSQAHDHAHADPHGEAASRADKAVAVLMPVGESGVRGKITIEREGQAVRITGRVQGLEPNSKHGFHIHEFGDLSDRKAGESVGGHFAGEGEKHGRPDDPAHERHAGDLGNIEADDQGVAKIDIRDEVIRLDGPHGVLGRAFVVHAEADEFTQPSGDAGDRIAFGVIGLAKSDKGNQSSPAAQDRPRSNARPNASNR